MTAIAVSAAVASQPVSQPVCVSVPPAFLKALPTFKKVINAQTTVPILETLVLSSDGSALVARGTDLELAATYRVELDIIIRRPFSIAVKYTTLMAAVKGAEHVLLTIDESAETITVDADGARVVIPTLLAADFPPAHLPENVFVVASAPFADTVKSLSTVASCASIEQARGAVLMGVNIETGKPAKTIPTASSTWGLTISATDGYVLAQTFLPMTCSQDTDKPTSAILPGTFIALLSAVKLNRPKAKTKSKVSDPVVVATLKIGKLYAWLEVGGFTLCTRLVDGAYPNTAQIFPINDGKRFSVNRQAMIKTLNAVIRHMGLSYRHGNRITEFEITDKHVTVTANSDVNGKFSQALPITSTYEGTFLSRFNAATVVKVLDTLSSETVEIDHSDPAKPARVWAQGESTVALVMPLRR